MKIFLMVNILLYFLGLIAGIYNCHKGKKTLGETEFDATISVVMIVWAFYYLF